MDYNAMTDYEINLRLLKLLLRSQPATKFHPQEVDEMLEMFDMDGGATRVHYTTQMGRDLYFDACNSWVDAGSLIDRYGIGLYQTAGGAWDASIRHGSIAITKVPQRSVAICALKHLGD